MFGIILLAPVIQLIFLGYAVNMDVEKISTVIFNMDNSSESRRLIEIFTSSNYFQIYEYVNNYDVLQEHIENGDALMGLVIPKDFARKLGRNNPVKLQAIFDGSDGNKASIAAGYVMNITGEYSKNILLDYNNKHGQKFSPAGSIVAEIRAWYNPTLKTRIFMVPGIVGLLLSIITLILTSLAIVKEKEIGTLEQIIVTPIKPYQLIVGKLIPFAILSLATIVLVLSAMSIIFDITTRGSLAFLFAASFLYILSTLGFGLFVSTISRTQQQAMMLAIFVVMLPMVFLSGFAFPIENMPDVIQWLTYAVPLRYFMTIIRGVILKGTGFTELWGEVVVLFTMGIAVLGLSALRFSKRLE
ncbi:MAG: ABC transporter permease [Melioribacteraceae bacterium]|nr:ABC transporter permease [Melioribacteraceae bacterium]